MGILFLFALLFFLIITYVCAFATCPRYRRTSTTRRRRNNATETAASGVVDVLIRYSPSKTLARAWNLVDEQLWTLYRDSKSISTAGYNIVYMFIHDEKTVDDALSLSLLQLQSRIHSSFSLSRARSPIAVRSWRQMIISLWTSTSGNIRRNRQLRGILLFFFCTFPRLLLFIYLCVKRGWQQWVSGSYRYWFHPSFRPVLVPQSMPYLVEREYSRVRHQYSSFLYHSRVTSEQSTFSQREQL